MRFALSLICLAATFAGATSPTYKTADIYLATSSDGRTDYDDALHIAVKNPKQVAELASFFPGLGDRPAKGSRPAGWRSWGWVNFHQPGKKDVNVYFARNAATWSIQGVSGDFQAKPGLKSFLFKLGAK